MFDSNPFDSENPFASGGPLGMSKEALDKEVARLTKNAEDFRDSADNDGVKLSVYVDGRTYVDAGIIEKLAALTAVKAIFGGVSLPQFIESLSTVVDAARLQVGDSLTYKT